MLDCFSLVAIVVTIVNKHHIRKIDSKIMIILCFASFPTDSAIILSYAI